MDSKPAMRMKLQIWMVILAVELLHLVKTEMKMILIVIKQKITIRINIKRFRTFLIPQTNRTSNRNVIKHKINIRRMIIQTRLTRQNKNSKSGLDFHLKTTLNTTKNYRKNYNKKFLRIDRIVFRRQRKNKQKMRSTI